MKSPSKLSLLILPVFLWANDRSAAAEAAAPSATPSFQLIGFATVNADDVNGTTGGGTAAPISVHNAKEFQDAVERTDIKNKKQRDNAPRVIRVDADIDLGVLGNQKAGNELKSVGQVYVRSNTTIYSPGQGATIRHGTLDVHGAHNVIIRNLKFRDLWEKDPTDKYDRFGWDYIRIVSSGQERSHHVWVDHCDFVKVYDGMVDITHGSDLITVSWCRFAGDEHGPQKKVSLIGHSSSANAAALDKGRLNVTFHHNWFENINDRAPRARFGNIHALDNYINGAINATISVVGAVTLVDNCFYKDTRIATTFSHAADAVAKGLGGTICIVDSMNVEPRPPVTGGTEREQFEIDNNFKSNVERAKLEFNKPADWQWENRNTLPYEYKADPASDVPALVERYAGTGKVADAELTKTGH